MSRLAATRSLRSGALRSEDSASRLNGGSIFSLPLTRRHGPVDLAAGVGLLQRFALIVGLLALRNGDLNLRDAALEVHPQRHEREAAFLSLGGELFDLAAVQEQLSRALRLVVEPVAERVFGNL